MSRGRSHGREVGFIDLGHEPPLSVDGSEAAVIDRRRVSVQWFSGTILTGLCGAALIGGAVFASLDGEMTFAKAPERVEAALRGAFGADKNAALHKSDRLPPPSESQAARNVIRVSTVSRVGSRDVVRVRPFIKIAGNLSLSTSELSAKIPPFNAQRMLSDVGVATPAAEDAQNPDAVEPDAEVSFITRDLGQVLPRAKIAGFIPPDEILMRVRDAASWKGNSGVRYASATAGDIGGGGNSGGDMRLGYAPEGASADPYAGFETRIVPENVTLLPKTKEQVTGGNATGERVHIVKKGDTVISVLRDQGASEEDATAVATALGARGRSGGLKEGQKLKILMEPTGPAKQPQPFRVIIANDSTVEAVAALSDLGRYVAVDVQALNTVSDTADNSDEDEDDGTGVRLYQSIYETALRNKVPQAIIDDMIKIYSYDVDFQRRVQAGDSFEVFYAGDDETTTAVEKNDVLFAALTVGGETKKYYRFQTPDDSVVDFYDETGKSAKKFLVRKPVNNAIMRSGFGGRRHPILGYVKMHTGVDWSTPYGTPIFASGNGVIEKAGWEGGYGKYIRIKHNNGYETAYGHMSAFAKGMEPGKRVRQGQVIGFVGSTGLSTGAHVHYEILVNGRFVDPMRVKLPRGRSLGGPLLASFEKERDRLDAMLAGRGVGRFADDLTATTPARSVSAAAARK
ncbi:M23 family metallopeptidase [Rhodopseudomonas sp. NSM]|uniref:M23 family metallopeptidase n=1 Tax=Rhodopseudomonas sp. NSM TaxID=3457630 RepID=UPI0040374B3B